MTDAIKPFRIAIGDEVLDDLKTRLRRTRWPEAELVEDWSQGAPLKWIQEICGYWADKYDWRDREARRGQGLARENEGYGQKQLGPPCPAL